MASRKRDKAEDPLQTIGQSQPNPTAGTPTRSTRQTVPTTSSRTPRRTPKTQAHSSRATGSAKRKGTPRHRASPKSQPSTSRRPATKQRRRYRPGVKALKEIRQFQSSTRLCIRKLPFSRLVREIQQRLNPRVTHWQVDAIAALQEAAEAYLVRFLEDCNDTAAFAKRVTVMQKDIQFTIKLRGRHGLY